MLSYQSICAKRIQFAAHCSVISFTDPSRASLPLFMLELICFIQLFELMEIVGCKILRIRSTIVRIVDSIKFASTLLGGPFETF